jgi:cytoskeletal protein CcmA (bactofilin family)
MQNEVSSNQRPVARRPDQAPNGKLPSGSREEHKISVIGADITVSGDIHASEDLVIEGTVEGGVSCGTLVIGKTGRVQGDIRTERLRLAGTVEGSIVTNDLAIESTAQVGGDIEYSRLRVESGGIIEGRLIRREDGAKDGRAESANSSRQQPNAVFEDRSYSQAQEALRNAAA